MLKDADNLLATGKISNVQYQKIAQEANFAIATGTAKNAESKTERFKSGIKKVGTVVVGTVGGLIAGGPAGAVAGFVTTAQSTQSGIAPGVDFKTPPIVEPSSAPGPTNPETGEPYTSDFWSSGHWVPFALLGVFFLRKRIAKLFRQ